MGNKLVIGVSIIALLISLAIVANVSSQSTMGDGKVWINDMEGKPKNVDSNSQNIARPPKCICSKSINVENNEIVDEFSKSHLINAISTIPNYIINCQCGKLQCVLTNLGRMSCAK